MKINASKNCPSNVDEAIPKQHIFAYVRDELGLALLMDPAFLLFAVANFFTNIGFNVPYVHIVASAI